MQVGLLGMSYLSERPWVVPEFSMFSSKMDMYDLVLLSHATVFGPRNHLNLNFRVSSLRRGWLKLGSVARLHGFGVLGREFFIAPQVNLPLACHICCFHSGCRNFGKQTLSVFVKEFFLP